MSHLPGRNDQDLHDEEGNHRVPTVKEVYDPHLDQMVVPGRALERAEARLRAHLRQHAVERPAIPVKHLSEEQARAEAEQWARGDIEVICDQAAQTIASWFQTPGRSGPGPEFAVLATTGQTGPGLARACELEIRDHPLGTADRRALDALQAYAEWSTATGKED